MTEATTSNYWLSPTALYITLNALGKPNYIQANTSNGTQILVYVKDIIGYDNGHNYRRWNLTASPTLFGDSLQKYVYVAIPRDANDNQAFVCYPSEHIDIYGCNESGTQIGETTYYYIWLQGIISAPNANDVRDWTQSINCGTLSSDEAISSQQGEWFVWDAVSEMVTFVKTVLSATINTLTIGTKLIFGSKTLTDVADGTNATDESSEHIATPAFVKVFGNAHYLRKDQADEAAGHITFNDGATVNGNLDFGTFNTGMQGGRIDENGDGELKSLTLRESLTVPKLVYNRTEVVGGNTWRCAGGGEIDTVTPLTATTGKATLKLEDGELAMIAQYDICMGIYHLSADNETENSDTKDGNFKFAGFKTIYFSIDGVDSDGVTFSYTLRDGYTTHPQPHMNFAAYGNFRDDNRQTSELQTRTYTLLLKNVSSWTYGSDNIVLILGQLSGFTIGSTSLQGNGLAFGNAYMWGNIRQIDRIVETFSVKLSTPVIQLQLPDWYDEDTKDEVDIEFTAQVVTSQNITVAPSSDTVSPISASSFRLVAPDSWASSGTTVTITSLTLTDNVYTVKAHISGYIPEAVNSVMATENTLQVGITTAAQTTWGTLTLIASKDGKDGEDGLEGEPGTSIEVEGSSVGHYNSYEAMIADIENIDDGIVLMDSIQAEEQSVTGSFLCTVADHEAVDVPTSIDEAQPKGTTYVNSDGHLYVAGDSGEIWTDCGEIKGQDGEDAVTINVSQTNIVAKKTTTALAFTIAIDVFKGSTQLGYAEGSVTADTFLISTLNNLPDGLTWSFTTKGKTAYYRLILAADTVVDASIPFTVTVGDVDYPHYINFHTVDDGARGYTGAMARLRGEYSATTDYFYNEHFRDIVMCKEEDGYHYYAVKVYGTAGTLGTPSKSPTEWEAADEFNFVATELLLAQLAYIKNLGVNNLIISHDENNTTVIDGGFCATEKDESGQKLNLDDIRLWLGGSDPSSAPFRVDKYGNFVASKATLNGSIVSEVTSLMRKMNFNTAEEGLSFYAPDKVDDESAPSPAAGASSYKVFSLYHDWSADSLRSMATLLMQMANGRKLTMNPNDGLNMNSTDANIVIGPSDGYHCVITPYSIFFYNGTTLVKSL